MPFGNRPLKCRALAHRSTLFRPGLRLFASCKRPLNFSDDCETFAGEWSTIGHIPWEGEAMNSTLRALNRFGLGARLGEKDRIGDPRNWLKSQLDPSRTGIDATNLPSLREVGSALGQARKSQNTSDEETRRTARQGLREISGREISGALQQRIATNTPFLERLVAFWSNHLCVSAQAKPQVLSLAGHYEREVIRPHVLGRFSNMVLASARHPAMLFYLDNARSIGHSSRGSQMAARRGRKRGLNENYARELLELHTVGVDGGYTQKDVEQLALIFTGWTVAGLGQGMRMGMGGASQPAFMFRAALHEPGAKRVLGVKHPEAGVTEGERVIRDLCRRPQTARFVANKLVGHFVSDDPPDAAVERIAATFQETEGDLLKVSTALVDLEEAWEGRKSEVPHAPGLADRSPAWSRTHQCPTPDGGTSPTASSSSVGTGGTEGLWRRNARVGRPGQSDEPGGTRPLAGKAPRSQPLRAREDTGTCGSSRL